MAFANLIKNKIDEIIKMSENADKELENAILESDAVLNKYIKTIELETEALMTVNNLNKYNMYLIKIYEDIKNAECQFKNDMDKNIETSIQQTDILKQKLISVGTKRKEILQNNKKYGNLMVCTEYEALKNEHDVLKNEYETLKKKQKTNIISGQSALFGCGC
jgi:hypothetical protein